MPFNRSSINTFMSAMVENTGLLFTRKGPEFQHNCDASPFFCPSLYANLLS